MQLGAAILLLIQNEGGRVIRGRTLLQKRLYFLEQLTEVNFGYRPYYYGPYSSTVSQELDALVASGLVQDVPKFTGIEGPFGEVVRHDYCMDSNLRLDVLLPEGEDVDVCREQLARIADHPVAKDIRLLSIAAKVHFIVDTLGEDDVEQVKRRAEELGWDVSEEQIKQVSEYLTEHLGLLKGGL